MAFERICREQGIRLIHGLPGHPTTTGKIERLHQTLQEECLFVLGPFADIEAAQKAIDIWRQEYNTSRPHQSLDMASPATRFVPREPVMIAAFPLLLEGGAPAQLEDDEEIAEEVEDSSPPWEPSASRGLHAVELERIGPESGNLSIAHQQVWLGPHLAGRRVTLWAGTSSVHVIVEGRVLKTIPSRLSSSDLYRLLKGGARPAGPPPRNSAAIGIAAMHHPIEFDRTVNAVGHVSVAGHNFSLGVALAGRRVTLRLDEELCFVIVDGVVVSTIPSPIPRTARARIVGARVAGPMPPARSGPLVVTRRLSSRGQLSLGGERYSVGLRHADKLVKVLVSDKDLTVTDEGEILKIVGRRDRKEIQRLKGGEWRSRLVNNS